MVVVTQACRFNTTREITKFFDIPIQEGAIANLIKFMLDYTRNKQK